MHTCKFNTWHLVVVIICDSCADFVQRLRREHLVVDPDKTCVHRYEYEEHIATCEAMEQTAQLFLQDSGQLHEA